MFTPTIQEFPADGRIWRVDFLGGLERNPAIPDEPTIQVIISPLRDASLREDSKLASVTSVIDGERMTIRIGVGQLPYLKVGSLWQYGLCLQYSAGTERVYNLTIDKTQDILTAHHLVGGEPLIHPRYHRIGAGTEAFCVTLMDDGARWLIIPTMELLRFYYAVSTPLARAILIGNFFQNLSAVIDPHHSAYNSVASTLVLKLRRALYDIEGWIIGRMLVAQEAKLCLQGLRDSIVSQSSKGLKVIYPTAQFPFYGPTRLTVRGKPIKTDDDQWRFLVFSIEHCTAPFPFENLIVDREFSNPNLEGIPSDDQQLKWLPAHMRKKPVTPSEQPIIQSKREPTKDRAPTIFPVFTDAFAFLRDKKVEKLGREQLTHLCQNSGMESQNVFAEMFSTGEGGYASGNAVAPAEIHPLHRRKGLPADLEIFRELLEELNKLGAEACLREPSDETSHVPVRGPGRWRYLDYDLRTSREVAVGDVLWRNRWWCLVEFQQRAKDSCNMGILTCRSNREKLTDVVLGKMLYGLANVRGVWKNIEPAYRPGIFVKYIKHSSATPAEFARAVVQKIMF